VTRALHFRLQLWLYEQWQSKRLTEELPGLTADERDLFKTEFERTKHHEHRAALVCVLTGLIASRSHFSAIGDVKEGRFFLPPWSSWKKWAQDAIKSGIRDLNQEGAKVQVHGVPIS
jgi:hypothetical protein